MDGSKRRWANGLLEDAMRNAPSITPVEHAMREGRFIVLAPGAAFGL